MATEGENSRSPATGGARAPVASCQAECSDDSLLVERYRRGDVAAFEGLFRRHHAAVYRVAFRLSPCPDDAADVVQEAFLAAWEQRERFRGRASFRTWLIAIAIRRCADRARAVRIVSLDGADPPLSPASPATSPQTLAVERERDEALHAAILALPRAQRAAVVLHYIEGLTCAETGAALGISAGTVMTHLARARASLRWKLSWLGEEETLGVDCYLDKPFDPMELLVFIRRIFESRAGRAGLRASG